MSTTELSVVSSDANVSLPPLPKAAPLVVAQVAGRMLAPQDNPVPFAEPGQPAITREAEETASFSNAAEARAVLGPHPHHVGPYHLMELLGEGGMGSVYLAEQQEPMRRRVALKLVKLGMDTKEVVARFEAERQALALMNHPNIASVLDAGATEHGLPFFVMEFVPGIPITDYCDRHRLGLRERLELFGRVCEAVQHAHQKGIIHRDIKPSNVLVMMHDGRPMPKVIDFGVAKATNQRLTERTIFTEQGRIIGTPAYMSPEQAEMTALDIDTRTDVYSLGVLLYELLVGVLPFDPKSLRAAGYKEMQRIIREVEPAKPSTRISTLGDESTEVAQKRHVEPRVLARQLRGDLDWITLKAMEKDRTRRYATASELAADILRHLNHEPVLACPPSLSYRLTKLVRRHRVPAAAAAAVLVALAGGLVATTILYLEADAAKRAEADQRVAAERQRQAAIEAQQLAETRRLDTDVARQAEAKQRERAEREQAEAVQARDEADQNFRKVLQVVDRMLTKVGMERLYGVPHMEPVRRELVEDALTYYKEFLAEKGADPLVRDEAANAYATAAKIQEWLSQQAMAEENYHRAIDLSQRLVSDFPGRPEYRHRLATCQQGLGWLLNNTSRHQEALQSYRSALTLWDDLAANFPDEPKYRRAQANIHRLLGRTLAKSGPPREAEDVYRKALTLYQECTADNEAEPEIQLGLASTLHLLGLVLKDTKRSSEAEDAFRDAQSRLEALVADFPNHPSYRWELANLINSLGILLNTTDRHLEAEKAYRQALQLRERLAADFSSVPWYQLELASAEGNLGWLFAGTKRPDEAEEAYDHARVRLEKLVVEYPHVPEYQASLANNHNNRGILFEHTNRVSQAIEAYRRAVGVWEQLAAEFPAVPDYQSHLGGALSNLSEQLLNRGEKEEARHLLERAIEHQQAALTTNPHHPLYLQYLAIHYKILIKALTQLNDNAAAEKTVEEFVGRWKQLAAEFPTEARWPSELGATLHNWAGRLSDLARLTDARATVEQAIVFQQAARKLNPRDATSRQFLRNHYWRLTQILVDQGEHAKAAETTAEMPNLYPDGWEEYHRASGYLARCVALAEKDEKLVDADRPATMQKYADQALAMLRAAFERGYKDAEKLQQDPHFDSIRSREDFKKLLTEMAEKGNREPNQSSQPR